MLVQKTLMTVGVVVLSTVLYVLAIGYRKRAKINKLRKQGFPMPEWNWWTGHLLVLQRALKDLPPDVNVYWAMQDLVKEFADSEMYLLDLWPMYDPVVMVFGHEISHQLSNVYSLPKVEDQQRLFLPIVGGKTLISMNDEHWRFWRGLFNPGFSAAHMLDLVPAICDSVEVFCEQLQKQVGKGVTSLDAMTTRLTMDIITKTTLDTDLDNQRNEHELSRALNTILRWHSFWDPRILLNPLRPFVQGYYSRIMDRIVRKELEKRFTEMIRERSSSNKDRSKRAKSVIALALDEYIKSKQTNEPSPDASMKLDEGFARIAANQIRLFIFAGNDSTSSTIVYTYHLLSQKPNVIIKLREEHDAVFGTDTSTAVEQLKRNPALLNQCHYSMAIIKETLRLYPPGGSLREGRPGISIKDHAGNSWPTEGLNATGMHNFIHTNPRVWPRPKEFLPERWLVEPGHELYVSPTSGAYRPFEHGNRNCIAQPLVYNELRIALILTARTFSIMPAYDEWDALHLANEGLFTKLLKKTGLTVPDVKIALGERAYQTSQSGAHPADGYPCRVSFVV